MRLQQVCLIGIFPPPLHGMSLITEFVRKKIASTNAPLVIDYSPRNLDRSFMVRLSKLYVAFRGVFQFLLYLLAARVGKIYLGLSGGNGQIYDLVFVCISRLFGRMIYLHHHSYQYLNRVRWLSRLLFSIAGSNTIHIVACEKMARDLKCAYPVVKETRVISGVAALMLWNEEVRPREKIQTIGFLSNISVEKGILEFLDIATWAESENLTLRFVIAGPYQDEKVRFMVESRLSVLRNVLYVGGVYADEKRKFFDSLDVFLFPTKYVNESEGLVIHEAMSRAVPVIAYSRGCIEQIISESVGLKLAPTADYVAGATNMISDWLSDPGAFNLVSQSAFKQYCEARAMHITAMDELCAELINGEFN
ncbi:MAG: glycosyltransferase family 4 protein [Gallionellaceae bacterium]|jgi:glycosyltransferase involved in cell wall biosynthesis